MSDYQSISIKNAMGNIANNSYLLPAIQRKFVWSMEQVEKLFDSILRGYPINSFMLWRITDLNIKQDYKFYQFIKDFIQRFGEDNPDAPTQLLTNDFYAVIDGQQRLTSLYIGLIGSYTIKKPYKQWKKNEHLTPMDKKELYLELTSPLILNIDNEKMYNFRFLSTDEFNEEKNSKPNLYWYKVGDVIKLQNLAAVNAFLIKNNLLDNEFAVTTLTQLFSKFNTEKMINYYCVDDQDQDKVLDIFIRTNSGGTPLSFSDLLMSISSANWTQFDAREEMKSIKEKIYSYGNPNFNVSQDFILKSLLVLSDVDVRFKIDNFGRQNIALFEQKWSNIKKSLDATFNLLDQLNFNDSLLRAKNAAIPIAYYIYKNDLADKIIKSNYDENDKKNISKWLSMSLLKGIFGGTSDSILKSIRNVIKNSTSKKFPVQEIFEEFKSDADKNYTFGDDVIKSFLNEQYGSGTCGIVLNLLYPDVVLSYGKNVAQDHMHPKSVFEDKKKLAALGLTPEQEKFYKDKSNYNSCLNLQLLECSKNESKGDEALSNWASSENKTYTDLYIKKKTSLDIKEFEKFIKARSEVLLEKLKNILKI
ncbi:MAG: DUF262 domain-containing protein [Candidatus Onthovivens sp.]|nr:DUF262 domain-containing protein [Candidatus Onthovivens sp.]